LIRFRMDLIFKIWTFFTLRAEKVRSGNGKLEYLPVREDVQHPISLQYAFQYLRIGNVFIQNTPGKLVFGMEHSRLIMNLFFMKKAAGSSYDQ